MIFFSCQQSRRNDIVTILSRLFHDHFTIFSRSCIFRFEEFEHDNPGKTTSVCIVSALSDNATNLDPYGCETTIGVNVYLHTVYIGLACIPGSIILPIFVHKLGAKFFLSKYSKCRLTVTITPCDF